jgi:hypothetical protein
MQEYGAAATHNFCTFISSASSDTIMYNKRLGFVSAPALASYASAATIRVDIGPNGAIAFSPDSITASVGGYTRISLPSGESQRVWPWATLAIHVPPANTGGLSSGFMPVSFAEAVSHSYTALNPCLNTKLGIDRLFPRGH